MYVLFYRVNQKILHLTQMQKRKYVYRTADREHCFDLSGIISAVGVTDVYSRQYTPEKEFLLMVCNYTCQRTGWAEWFLAGFDSCIATKHKQKIFLRYICLE